MTLVLLVEDEPMIADVLEAYLRRDDYAVVRAGDGKQAVELHRQHRPDVVLLDVSLPGVDGFEVLRRIRSAAPTPVIMVTARDEDLDKLLGLHMGADDYIVKPFSPLEVVARVKAVLRRSGSAAASRVLRAGTLEVDVDGMSAAVAGRPVGLTLSEFNLLRALLEHRGMVLSRSQLLDRALPDSGALDRVVDAHLGQVRRKLAAAGEPHLLETVRGAGYRIRRDA